MTDDATGKYWPVGLKLATMLGAGGKRRSYPMAAPHGPDPPRSYFTTTRGHDQRQISHRFKTWILMADEITAIIQRLVPGHEQLHSLRNMQITW